MGWLKRGRPVSDEEQLERNVDSQQAALDDIGKHTDVLAEESLRQLDKLPAEERSIFWYGVLRRLALQMIVATDGSLKSEASGEGVRKVARRLGGASLHEFGSGATHTRIHGGQQGLIDAVIGESLRDTRQLPPQLAEAMRAGTSIPTEAIEAAKTAMSNRELLQGLNFSKTLDDIANLPQTGLPDGE